MAVRRALAGVALALALLAGCGGDADDRPRLGEAVPRDAFVFFSAELDRESDEGREADRFVEWVGGGRQSFAEILIEWLEFEGDDVSYERDIAPWIGGDGAMFAAPVRGPDPAGVGFLAEVSDAAAAERRLRDLLPIGARRREHAGWRYWASRDGVAAGIHDGKAVFATHEPLARAIVDAARDAAPSLADRDDFARGAEGEATLMLWIDGSRRDLLERAGIFTARDLGLLGSFLPRDGGGWARVDLDARSATMEAEGFPVPAGRAPALAERPAEAWFAATSGQLGMTLEELLGFLPAAGGAAVLARDLERAGVELRGDLLARMGRGYVHFDALSNELNGRVVVEQVRDPDALDSALARLRRSLRRRSDVAVHVADATTNVDPYVQFEVQAERLSALQPFYRVELAGQRLEIHVGAPAMSNEELGDTPHFEDARERLDGDPTMLIDMRALDPSGRLWYFARRDEPGSPPRMRAVLTTAPEPTAPIGGE